MLIRILRAYWPLLLLAVLLTTIVFAPIHGQVVVTTSAVVTTSSLLPEWQFDPPWPQAGQTVTVSITDNVPWAHVLLAMDGKTLPLKDWTPNPNGTWTWRWSLNAVTAGTLVFYHDCEMGCIERAHAILGSGAVRTPQPLMPTKLGVVFANPQRDWHGRSGWDLELTYARLSDQEYWGVDDLAARIAQASRNGLRVLVRVDYAKGQSLPPGNDLAGLSEYVQYVRRLARDARLHEVYAFIIGSGFNDKGSNSLTPAAPVTAEWYARLFNGYGQADNSSDNVVQAMRAENPWVRILVGPVRPWSRDQNGDRPYVIDVPWLNYMNTLAALLDQSAQQKAAAGIPFAGPDGFAVNAPGRPGAPELAGRSGADEPRTDLLRAEWNGAQAGFRIYQEWLDIINAYPTTRGLPVYITSANTFAPDSDTLPAQNYVRGWLTAALDTINHEPQVQALCWFLDDDFSRDTRWDSFSLSKRLNAMNEAADEFDALLR